MGCWDGVIVCVLVTTIAGTTGTQPRYCTYKEKAVDAANMSSGSLTQAGAFGKKIMLYSSSLVFLQDHSYRSCIAAYSTSLTTCIDVAYTNEQFTYMYCTCV